MNIHLRNEGQECKTDPMWGLVLVGGWRMTERVKESKYGQCTLYTYMKIKQ
jgi:hypothetical protein